MAAETTTDPHCCPPPSGEARAAASAAACERELAEMALSDPTLSSCCARDLKEQRQAARLRTALAAGDRTAARERERGRAVAMVVASARAAAAASQQQQRAEDDSDYEDEDNDDDDDPQLAQLREARLAELRRRAAERRSDASAGFGRLNDASPAGVVGSVRACGAVRCVVHLAADGHEAGAQLDERLAELARAAMPSAAAAAGGGGGKRGGALFLRAPVGAAAAPSAASLALCRDLGLCGRGAGGGGALARGALPALLVLSPPASLSGGGDGASAAAMVAACAPVARFCAEDGALVDDRVDAFLRGAGVVWGKGLLLGVGGGGGGESGSGSGDDDDDGGEEEGQPCHLCGRTYPHEHVRAVYGRRDDGGGGVDGGSSSGVDDGD